MSCYERRMVSLIRLQVGQRYKSHSITHHGQIHEMRTCDPHMTALLLMASAKLVISTDSVPDRTLSVVIIAVNTVKETSTAKLVDKRTIRPKIVCGL